MNISETNGPIKLEFLCFLFSKSRIYSTKIIKFWQLIWQFQNSVLLLCSIGQIPTMHLAEGKLMGVCCRRMSKQTFLDFRLINKQEKWCSSPWRGRQNPCLPSRRGGPGSIPCGVRNFNFNFYPGTGRVLSCVASGGGPDILLTTDFRQPHPCVSVQCAGQKSVMGELSDCNPVGDVTECI